MIYVAILLALLTLGLLFWKPKKPEESSYDEEINFVPIRKWTMIVSASLALIITLLSSVTIINSGNVGVKVLFGQVLTAEYLTEGIHIVNPLVDVVEMSIRTQTYTMSSTEGEEGKKVDDAMEVISSDGLTLKVEISVPYRLVPAQAAHVYQKFGEHYQESIIRSAIRSAIREAFSFFTAQETYSAKREQTKILSLEKLIATVTDLSQKAGMSTLPIEVDQVLVRDIQLPASVKTSIEAKISSQQESEKMDFVIAKEKKEAERKRVEAQGIHDFQRIVSSGITDDLLRWKGIEATEHLANSPNSKIIFVGDKSGLPLVLGAQ